MDSTNKDSFVSKEAINYWKGVDLYLGGSEHATGHLLYSRFYQKFLFDLNILPINEYASKLINQGMILGNSSFIYRERGTNKFYSKDLIKDKNVDKIRIDISYVDMFKLGKSWQKFERGKKSAPYSSNHGHGL